MEKKLFKEALQVLKKSASKRKFSQSIDLIINLKDLNLKQTSQHIDFFMQVPHARKKEVKICALVGAELLEPSKESCDKVIINEEWAQFDKKTQKKLAREYDFFIAQANLMTDVAKRFGRVFGPLGKMPNPKAECVITKNTNLQVLVEKLRKTIRIKIKTQLSVKAKVGTEKMEEEKVVDNCVTILDHLIHHLPNEKNNIKNIMLKLTMSKPIKVDKGLVK